MNTTGIVYTRSLRARDLPCGGIAITEAYCAEIVGTDDTWVANCRVIAAEANADRLFGGQIDWVLVSLIGRELLEPRRRENA